jgi:hypothetical protein
MVACLPLHKAKVCVQYIMGIFLFGGFLPLLNTIDISQYRLLFVFFLLYTDRVPFELLDSPALVYMKGELRWRGQIVFINLTTII